MLLRDRHLHLIVFASDDPVAQEKNDDDMNVVSISKNIPFTLSPAWRNTVCDEAFVNDY